MVPTRNEEGRGDRAPGAARGLVRAIETAEWTPALGLAAFLAIVYLRNLLEGVLEKSRLIGFVRDPGASSLMIFDHFLLFYAALFAVLVLVLSAVTCFPLRSVLRVLVVGWVLVLIPPIVDAAASGGRGYAITYIPNLAETSAAFFHSTRTIPEVSIGQRIEITAGILLVFGYAWVGGAGLLRSLAAGASFYAVISLFGALPVLFARLSFRRGEWMRALDPVTAVYRSGGVIPHESQKHALLFLFLLIGAGAVLLVALHPKKAAAVRRHLRPLRTIHYAGLALFGALLGAALLGPYLEGPAVATWMDLLGIAAIVLSVAFAFHAGAAWNDLSDVRSDRVNAPNRPLAAETLGKGDVRALALLYAAASLLLAANVAYVPFLLVLGALVLSGLYSFPPFRLKRFPLVATATLGAVSALAFLAGFAVFAGGRAFHLAPPRLLLALLAGVTAAFGAKDLKDGRGDALDRVWTLPVLLGERNGRRVTAALVFIGFLLPALVLPIRTLLLPGLVFAAAGLVFTLRFRRPDRPLLLLYLPYACLVFALVLSDLGAIGATPEAKEEGMAFAARRSLLAEDYVRSARLFALARSAGGEEDFPLERGMALVGAGSPAEAVPFLRAARAGRPDDGRASTALAEALRRSGDVRGAERALVEMKERGSDGGEAAHRLAALALEAGDLARAAREIDAERALGAREEAVAVHEGDLLVLSGDTRGAAERYERAIRLEPRSPEAWAGLGRAEHAAGRLSEARQSFDRAIELDSTDAVSWNNAGVVERDLGARERALACFERARLLDPTFLHAYMNRGGLLEAMGESSRAADEYRLALVRSPGFPPALEALRRLGGRGLPNDRTPSPGNGRGVLPQPESVTKD